MTMTVRERLATLSKCMCQGARLMVGALADAPGEFGQPLAKVGRVHAALTASPPRRP